MFRPYYSTSIKTATIKSLMIGLFSLIPILSPAILLAHDDDPQEGGVSTRDDSAVVRPPVEEHHEVLAELGHKLHPIHAAFESRISGWLTPIAQGTIGSKYPSAQRNDRAEGSLSMDIFYEATLKGSSIFMLHLDVQQGAGLVHIPPLFASPNGNTTGPNNDIESFVNNQVHLDQAWYETAFGEGRWTLTLGQLDPTAYFDTNNYANNERFQFFANQFGNNPTIEFGGTGNFYGAGFRLTYSPSEFVDVTLGALDGDGDYSEMFDKPWVIAEVDLKPKLAGKEGNYRLYVWQNSLPHYKLDGNGDPTFVTIVGNPSDNAPSNLIDNKNSGLGINFDQVLTDNLGIWARIGMQDGDVSQFDRHVSAGLQVSGMAFNRPDDVIGIGLAYTMISDAYKDASGLDGNELYAEAYYNITVKESFQISPDIQYIVNPGGNSDQDPFLVYGVRAGVMF